MALTAVYIWNNCREILHPRKISPKYLRIIDFARARDMGCSAIFQHQNIHWATIISCLQPDRDVVIDGWLVCSVISLRTLRGSNNLSDHYLAAWKIPVNTHKIGLTSKSYDHQLSRTRIWTVNFRISVRNTDPSTIIYAEAIGFRKKSKWVIVVAVTMTIAVPLWRGCRLFTS